MLTGHSTQSETQHDSRLLKPLFVIISILIVGDNLIGNVKLS